MVIKITLRDEGDARRCGNNKIRLPYESEMKRTAASIGDGDAGPMTAEAREKRVGGDRYERLDRVDG